VPAETARGGFTLCVAVPGIARSTIDYGADRVPFLLHHQSPLPPTNCVSAATSSCLEDRHMIAAKRNYGCVVGHPVFLDV